MFLAIDIGNSRVSFGVFVGRKLHKVFHLFTADLAAQTDLGSLLEPLFDDNLGHLTGNWRAAISSVVPSLTDALESAIEDKLEVKPLILNARSRVDFNVRYNREQLGSDRLANVIAARKLHGFPAIVIDMGTATKYEVIDDKGDYPGGLIAPGLGISAEALFSRGAQLFPVKVEKPARFIAADTAGALKAGIFYGFIGQVEYVVEKIIRDLACTHVRVVATGGYAEIFGPEIPRIETVDPHLTLKGIEVFSNQ